MCAFQQENASTYALEPRRWVVLASFAVLSMCSAWIWISFSPLTHQIAEFWNVSEADVDALASVYFYVYVPCSFLSLYCVVNHWGLRNGLIVGAVLNAVGATIRYSGYDSYRTVYVGTFFCAVAQTFTLSTPPLISGSWFGDFERATATSLGVLANQLGTLLGLSSTVLIQFDVSDSSTFAEYLRLQVVVAFLALALIICFAADKPTNPPSRAAMLKEKQPTRDCEATNGKPMDEDTPLLTEKGDRNPGSGSMLHNQAGVSPTYFDSIKIVFGNKHIVAYSIAFGFSVGVYYSIPALLSQIVSPSWTLQEIGWLGFSYQISGIVGSFVMGRAADASQSHYALFLLLLWVALISIFVLFAYNAVLVTSEPVQITATFAGALASGFALAALNAFGLEFGTAMAYPADEAAVAGVLECSAELSGFVWVTISGFLLSNGAKWETYCVLLVAVATALSIALGTHFKSKRPT